MATSLDDLLAATHQCVTTSPATPREVAGAAAALGHLGRGVAGLRLDGLSRVAGDLRERQVQQLAEHCSELARTAPVAETRLNQLAAATADAIALSRRQSTVETRWAIAVATTDAIENITGMLTALPSNSITAQRVKQIATDTRRVQQSGALDPPTRQHNAILDSPIPAPWPTRAAASTAPLLDAMATLVHGVSDPSTVLSVAEVLAISLTAETLTRTAAAAGQSRPQHDRRSATAAEGWVAVQTALAPFNDGSRRRHTDAPDHIQAALVVHRIAHDQHADAATLADAIQHLPAVADALRRSVQAWPHTTPVLARAERLPHRDAQPPVRIGGNPADQLVRVDAVDLIPVTHAIVSARESSIALADQLGRGRTLRAHRSWAAHHEHAQASHGPDPASDQQAQAYARPRATPTRARASRPR